MPATTSSPCASARNSPYRPDSPVDGFRVNATPVPERVALVAEDHLHHVHRSAELVRDPVRAAIDLSAGVVPRLEDGAHCAQQLLARAGREAPPRLFQVDRLERLDELLQILGRQLRVLLDAALVLERRERALEPMSVDAFDHLAEHLDQPPVRVEREPRVARARAETRRRLVVQAEVEDRVHHPGHRDSRARAHRDEQRIVIRAEPLAGPLLEPRHVLVDLVLEPVGQVALDQRRTARVGGDREPRGHRDAHRGHLRQADSLAPQELTAAGRRLIEVVDVARCHVEADLTDGLSAGAARRNSATQASTRSPNQNGVKSP